MRHGTATLRRGRRPRWHCRSRLFASVSVTALIMGSGSAAANPNGYWSPSQAGSAAAAANAATAASQQAAIAAAQSQQSLNAALNTIRGMWNAQAAARATAITNPSQIINGIGKGKTSQTPGLVVDPRVNTDPNLWINASLPTQTTVNGQVTVTIDQTAPRAVLTWEYFNIGPNTTLIFDQQGNASWVALNRIDATGIPSQILGNIKADGTVLLINPNGIIFGGTSQINLGSLIASSLDIDTNQNASAFNNPNSSSSQFSPSYLKKQLSDGQLVWVPRSEDSANKSFVQSGLYQTNTGSSASPQPTVLFDLGSSGQNPATSNSVLVPCPDCRGLAPGAITVEAGAEITTAINANGDGGYVALLGTKVTNAGGVSSPNGQIILAAVSTVQLQDPSPTATGVNRPIAVSTTPISGSGISQQNATPPSLNGTGLVTNDVNAVLSVNDGNVTLIGDSIDQKGAISATTSVTRAGSVTLTASATNQNTTAGDIIFEPGSLLAILPDESSSTIPAADATEAYLASNGLLPMISINPGEIGSFVMKGGAVIKAPSASVNVGSTGAAAVLLENGSIIDLSGLAGVTAPASQYVVNILITPAEVADDPLAKSLIGSTVTVDMRLSGTNANGVPWIGSPILDISGYANTIPKTIDEILTAGGSLTVQPTENPGTLKTFIQEQGAVINVSGGSIDYQGGLIQTTKLLNAYGQVTDIGSASPTIDYVGIAGQFSVDRSQWGQPLIYTSSLIGAAVNEPAYVTGADAGSVTVEAQAPILEGSLLAETITGLRQHAGLEPLPLGASLSITFDVSTSEPSEILLESRADAGLDPFGLSNFSLATAAGWTPTLTNGVFPVFSDLLSASNFESIKINPSDTTLLSMKADATLSVQPGGSVTLNDATTINGTINAPSGSITLTGFGGATAEDLIIGPTALLNVRGLWINDYNMFGNALQGSAFVNGGSISISTPASSNTVIYQITSGTITNNPNPPTDTFELVTSEDTTASIVLAPGSVLDLSSGGYVGSNGKLQYGSDGLPIGKGGSLTLQTYTYTNSSGGQSFGFYPLPDNINIFKSTAETDLTYQSANGSVVTVAKGTNVYYYDLTACNAGDSCPDLNPIPPYAPTDGVLRANVVMDGTIYAQGFDGGGTFNLATPSIKLAGTEPVTSYLTATSLQDIIHTVATESGLSEAAVNSAFAQTAGTVGTTASRVLGSATQSGEIDIPASFFNGNAFGAYILTSTVGDITIAPNTTISLRQSNLLPGGVAGQGLDVEQSTGAIARAFEAFGPVADGLRQPVNLTLYDPNGPDGILVNVGSTISADPGASGPSTISLVATDGPVTVLGQITAPSGSINLLNTANTVIYNTAIIPTADVWIGPQAVLDVSSLFVPNPLITTYSTGSLLDAGTITLAAGVGGSTSGTVVVESGAQLRLNGGSATVQYLDLSDPTQSRFLNQPLWSNGGTLQIAGNNLYFAGTVSAPGGAPLAAGGSLFIGNVPVPASLATGYGAESSLTAPFSIVLEPSANLIAASLATAKAASQSTADYPLTLANLSALMPYASGDYIGADTLSRSSFDSVSLNTTGSDGTIAFNGSIKVTVPGAFTLSASGGNFLLMPASSGLLPPGVTDPNAYVPPTTRIGTTVDIDAGYLQLIGNITPNQVSLSSPNFANGVLNVAAQWIDLQGVILLNDAGSANFTSAGPIRLLDEFYGTAITYPATTSGAPNYTGALIAPGNLTLSAAEIYPISQTEFLLMSTGTSTNADTLTIRQNGIAAAPLSAGGGIVLDAQTIVQGGTLWAPLGTIVVGLTYPDSQTSVLETLLGSLGYTFSDSGGFTPTTNVTLAAGSLTSVSAAGLYLPYGYTIDSQNWYIAPPPSSTSAAPVLTGLPAKMIGLYGSDIATKTGAIIDAEGGGDVFATEFVAGTGGSLNVLTTYEPVVALSTPGSPVYTSQYPDGRQVYALVPSYEAKVAAYDPTFANYPYYSGVTTNPGSNLTDISPQSSGTSQDLYTIATAPGTAITIGTGSGIPAGTYVLLPGMYATLPGAYRVVQYEANINPTAPANFSIADGSFFVSGTFTNLLTGARSSQPSLFEIQSSATWTQYSDIVITSGTSFFRSQALTAGEAIPPLPIDGGTLVLGATRTLSLEGTNDFAPGTSDLAQGLTGAGGQVQISASNILILASDQTESETDRAQNYLVLDADQLSNLGTASLLIGGTSVPDTTASSSSAAASSTGILITPEALSLEVKTDTAHPLTGPELILVTQGGDGTEEGLHLDGGSVIRALGTVPGSTSSSLTINGDSALLRVSNGPTASVTQVVPAGTTPFARLTIDSGVTIDGGNSLTLATTGTSTFAADIRLIAQNYDLIGPVINIGGGTSGLVLSNAVLGNFAGANSAELHSASVINFYDAQGLTIGNAGKPIGTLTFDAAGLSDEGGATTINAGNVVLMDGQASPDAGNALADTGGSLTIHASGSITFAGDNGTSFNTPNPGSVKLNSFTTVNLDAGQSIAFSNAGNLDAGKANVTLAAPAILVNAVAAESLTTTGTLTIAKAPGTAPVNAANNIGGSLGLTAATINDTGVIEALSGQLKLEATTGSLTLGNGAKILAMGSTVQILDQTGFAPGGAVQLLADAGNVQLLGGSTIDVSASGYGYAGSLTITASGTATLDGTLHGQGAFKDTGAEFSLSASNLSGALPITSGFTGSFAVTLQQGDIVVAQGTTLSSDMVVLTANNGNVIINGTIDSGASDGGSITLFGAKAVTIGSSAELLARYQAASADDPGYANGSSAMVQTGGIVTLGTTGAPNGTVNTQYGYENVASSGSGTISVASGALFDVSGGPGGPDIVNTGGEVILRAPILVNDSVNVHFHGTVVTTANTNADDAGLPPYGSNGGVVLDAYAVWSTTDASSGSKHFDGIIDPAGWYTGNTYLNDQSTLVSGTFKDASGTAVAVWNGSSLTNLDGSTNPLSYYLTNDYFAPATANTNHLGFYQTTLVNFVRGFNAVADFTGAQLRVGTGSTAPLPASLLHARPEIDLVNPDAKTNDGNITIADNWNLGAGTFNTKGDYVPTYRTQAGEPGILTLRALNDVNVNATVSDGFYETADAFSGSTRPADLVANLIANNPQMSGSFFDYNTTSAASLMSVVPGINNGSFSFDFVAGASFAVGSSTLPVNPNAVVALTTGIDPQAPDSSVTINGHTSYQNPILSVGFSANSPINIPTLLRTGTGSITIAAAGDVVFLDTTAPGAVYTAGAAIQLPSGFSPPQLSPLYAPPATGTNNAVNGLVSTPQWAAGGGGVAIAAGQSIIGIEPVLTPEYFNNPSLLVSGQDWSQWYYHAGQSNGTATPFSGIPGGCGPASFSCQTAAWVNYATFRDIGALGGGNIRITAGLDITGISASLPETLAVSGGVNDGTPIAHYYGGGNLLVQAGGNLYSGDFLVGRGTGLIEVGGSIEADPATNPITSAANVPLLLAVQDGYIDAEARGPVTLGAVYDPASLPLSYENVGDLVGGYTLLSYEPDANSLSSSPGIGQIFTTYGPTSGIALTSVTGDVTALGQGDTAFQANSAANLAVPFGTLLPATLVLNALSGNVTINNVNGDANLLPYPSTTGDDTGTIDILAVKSFTVEPVIQNITGANNTGTLVMPDLDTSPAQYVGNTNILNGISLNTANYISPLGIPLPTLSEALHANDNQPVIIAAGQDITAGLQLIKPAVIEAGQNIYLDFIGQNNNPSDVTLIHAGNDIGGFLSDPNVPIPSFIYLYGPGSLLLEAGHDMGPFQASVTTPSSTTAGIATLGDGSAVVGTIQSYYSSLSDALGPPPVIPYLPRQGASIDVLFGVGPGVNYAGAISQYVNPANAGTGGIDFLTDIAAILGEDPTQAWTAFQHQSPVRQDLLVDRAFLDLLTQVATDYENSASPYYGQYSRAYQAISTLFPAAYGYTNNAGTGAGGGVGASTLVHTGQLNLVQSVLETQLGGDINILGPGGGITVGSNSADSLTPSQEGILTLAGGSIRVFTDASILLNQSRILTLQGGNIELFSANGNISAGEGPKTYVSDPPITDICDLDGVCTVNPSGLVSGAGIGALITLPGQNPADSNVSLVAPHGTVDAGAAGIRVSGNLNILAVQVLNAYNVQVQGTSVGIPTVPTTNVTALTTTQNVAGAVQATTATAAQPNGQNGAESVIIVQVLGYGGGGDSGENTSGQ